MESRGSLFLANGEYVMCQVERATFTHYCISTMMMTMAIGGAIANGEWRELICGKHWGVESGGC